MKKDGKGKTRCIYKWYTTSWEMLRQLPGVAGYLQDDLTFQEPERLAGARIDSAATKMQQANTRLFATFTQRRSA
jgi:hypothetical protein